ncbi:MAG: cyclic nucleotide-binding domain-containing protein [Gemmataceae bacterium]
MPVLREDEALFSRDEDDRLIVREKASRDRFKDNVTISIDGTPVTIPRCVPATDFLGNEIKEADGLTKPRNSTIYDAARKLVTDGVWTDDELAKRIPVLCHREHLNPIAVCRMCSVHVSKKRKRDGKIMPSPKLVPACQHEVQPDMVVTTWCGGVPGEPTEQFAKEVAGPVRMLTELLLADHRHPDPVRDDRTKNELDGVAQRLGVDDPRPSIRPSTGRNDGNGPKSRPISLNVLSEAEREHPYSARTIIVDHDRCILCDRCARSCSDVKPFKVIGHTGKGYNTRVSFDLDEIMNDSSCVQCGECMTSCPTGALVLKRRVAPRAFADAAPIPEDPTVKLPAGYGFLTADEMINVSLDYLDANQQKRTFRPFATIPFSYLKWNEGAVRVRAVKPGDVLCREGEFGSTAFLLKSGSYEIRAAAKQGVIGKWFGGKSEKTNLLGTVDSSALILGELAALSNRPRTATIVAATQGICYEVTRNLLDMVQRSPSARDILGSIYTRNAVRSCLRRGKLFASLSDEERNTVARYLDAPGGAELRRVDTGETIVAEGAEAKDFYIVRQGFVKVTKQSAGTELILNRLTADDHFGETALLSTHPAVAPLLPPGQDARRRTASVVALDPVEVVRIPGERFLELCERYPALRDRLAEGCAELIRQNQTGRKLERNHLGDFINQGLFQGQKLLVLDLECCTRCDECTRACADAHGDGVSRLLREGLRFGDFLVATSCRSCYKPYCMDGCPVDAIHRSSTSLEVLIDSHCIGCGLCETNCPYGSIQLVAKNEADTARGMIAAVAKRAVNCDLCHGLVAPGADPFCVSACPHEAAFRWDGETVLQEVGRSK